MRDYLDRAYRAFTGRVSPAIAGRIDLLRPSFNAPWGGPLNGQVERRKIVRDIARAAYFDRVIETGTWRGTSTELFAAVFGGPVCTVEANERFFVYSKFRFRAYPEVKLTLDDSRSFLRALAARPEASKETVFAYLDAHWEEDLPLREELEIIGASWPRAVVMIDDFQVPDDPGYGYDDYGPDKRLTVDYLPAEALTGWARLFPCARSSVETGAKRGVCVLVSPAMRSDIEQLPTLRSA